MVEIPAFEVLATGVVDYKYPRVPNPLGRATIEQLAAFGGYSAGRNFLPFPDGAGVLLRTNAKLQFQTHYTPNGKAVRDVTRVGYYLHKAPPKYEMRKRFQ